MKAAALAFALVAPLAGCVTAEEKASAQIVYADCVAAAVSRMDDGKTDPVSLAYGIAPQCAVEYRQLTDAALSDKITERGRAATEAAMRDQELKGVTSAVLIHRAKLAKR